MLDRVELLPLDPVYQAVFPGRRYPAPADPERFRQELSILWPAEAEGIRRFFTEIDTLGREYLSIHDGIPPEGPLRKHHVRTLDGFLNDFTRDPELKSALSALWIFAGLPPGRLSVLTYAAWWHSLHAQGAAAVRGGVRNLSDALAAEIAARGGTVETRARVEQIHRTRGRVTGARLADGRELEARAILSTASPQDTFEEMLAAEGQAPAGYPPLRSGYITSMSALQVHLLVDGTLELPARTTVLHETYDLADAYLDLQRESPEFLALACTQLDRDDAERAPEGKHLLALYALAPYSRPDNWQAPWDSRRDPGYRALDEYRELKERLGDALVERAEALVPGLAGRVEARRVGTPLTMERYTLNTGGAAYGWAPIPEQAGENLPGARTPFSGLYMAGHWTFPGGGIAGAMTSGRIAARTALAAE